MDYHFGDEHAAHRQAEKILKRILSDKSYTNSQKLSLLISEYEKKQDRLDSQLSKAINSQLQSISQSKESVNEANHFMKEANEKTLDLKQIWNEQSFFHEIMQDLSILNTFQANIGKVIEQLTYFIDMDNEMNKLQKMAEDESKYQIVNIKLLNLITLRDALLEDSSWKGESAMMRKQFMKVNNFETSFYDKICNIFYDCISVAKENPGKLAIAVKVIESYDKLMEQKGKQACRKDQAIEIIKQSIDNKFIDQLQGQDDLFEVLEKVQFATKDMVDVGDYVVKHFSPAFSILQVFQKQYQQNIEKNVFPYFSDIEEEKQYGHLVSLLGWIDDYETMLGRAGQDSSNLLELKARVKGLMPQFIDHNQKLLNNFISNSIKMDEKNYTMKYYEQTYRNGDDLITQFPSDIFMFINQEADLIKGKLKGQIYIQFVRCITETVNNFQKELVEGIVEEWDAVRMVENENRIVEFEYKCLLFVNNFGQCLRHAGESKEIFAEHVSEEYKHRVEKIFMNQMQREFNASIPVFLGIVVQIIFLDVTKQLFPSLFTPKWQSDNSRTIINKILRTLNDELNSVEQQNTLINIIHYRMLVKETLDFFLHAYTEQLIHTICIVYSIESKEKYCSLHHTQKHINNDLQGVKKALQARVSFGEALKKDKHMFLKFLEGFNECTAKNHISKLVNKFTLLHQLFSKKKHDNQTILIKVAEAFPNQASNLVDAMLLIREDFQQKSTSKY